MTLIHPRPAFLVTQAHAHRAKTRHQFVPGLGHVAHQGPPDLPPGANGTLNTKPPAGTADGSIHLLRPPTRGAKPMPFCLVAAERAWASLKPGAGNRLAWPTEHLMRAGWEYVGPA